MPPIAPPLNEALGFDDAIAVALVVPVESVLGVLVATDKTVVLVTVVDAQCVKVLLLYVAWSLPIACDV